MRMQTKDSTLAYFVNQLDNFDSKLYEPLYSVKWGRDIKLRSGITIANDSTSFTRSTIGGIGTQSATGKPWISSNTTAIAGVSVDGERIVLPLRPLAREVSYSSIDLARSQLQGQAIDVQKIDALNILYQMSIDEMVYIGDTDVNATGLVNSTAVTAGNVAAGVGGVPWAVKTPEEILTDVNSAVTAAWAATGFAICPSDLLLPPTNFSDIAQRKIGSDGSVSILTYLEDNSISLRENGQKLNIRSSKWLTGRGAGGTNRMVAYTNDENRVRFPMVPIRRETPYYHGIQFNAPYVWAFGEVEFIYPETVIYRDGI